MRTSDADILAIGECAEVGGHVYGLVAPLYEMARVAAAQLCGDGAASFVHNDTPTKLKVTGIELFSLGDFVDDEDRQEIALRDAAAGVYKRLMIKDNRIIGAVLFGETSDGAWFNDLKNKEVDISEMRDTLIFGQAYQGGSPLDPTAAVAALPDDAEICGCNGVCKSDRRLGRSGGVKTMNRIAIGSTTDITLGGARCVATPRGEFDIPLTLPLII